MAITTTLLASGTGWNVRDVVCDHGPGDPVFEERHADVSIALVTAGSFQYRTRQGAVIASAFHFLTEAYPAFSK